VLLVLLAAPVLPFGVLLVPVVRGACWTVQGRGNG